MAKEKIPVVVKTNDLGEASALAVLGKPPLRLEHDDSGRATFVFEGADAEELSAAYWMRKLRVDPRGLMLTRRALLDQVKAGR